jgi:hypothetical protein
MGTCKAGLSRITIDGREQAKLAINGGEKFTGTLTGGVRTPAAEKL